MRSKNVWSWYASGKHPVTKDFFSLGQDQPIFRAFSDWVQKGYRMHSSTRGAQTHACSWRFWARGPKKQDLVCGLVKDSCDRLGRPHPLLVIGTGALGGWENHWDLLARVLEKTWQQMEYLATKRLPNFKHVEDGVRMLPFPIQNWSGLNLERQQTAVHNTGLGGSTNEGTMLQNFTTTSSDPLVGIMPLINISPNDQRLQLSLLHADLKKRLTLPPNAVFMGGIPEKSCLVLFKRPLRPEDFNTLWSSCAEVSSTQQND